MVKRALWFGLRRFAVRGMDRNKTAQRSRKRKMWQFPPVFSALGWWRQEGQEFKIVLSYIVTSRIAWDT